MSIKSNRNQKDYRAALREIDSLMSAEAGSPAGEKLDVLVTLVEAWERKHFPMELPEPVDAIRFQMEHGGLSARDLVPMIGQLNRVYEVLNRRRPLTLRMIWNLHQQLGMPLESLIKPPRKSRAA